MNSALQKIPVPRRSRIESEICLYRIRELWDTHSARSDKQTNTYERELSSSNGEVCTHHSAAACLLGGAGHSGWNQVESNHGVASEVATFSNHHPGSELYSHNPIRSLRHQRQASRPGD